MSASTTRSTDCQTISLLWSISSDFQRSGAASLVSFSQLEELDLSHSQIGGVPVYIGNMSGLISFRLSGCGLTAVPRALWSLTNLEKLELTGNPLPSLPAGIAALKKLKALDISRTLLRQLPGELQFLTQLARLSFSSTEIKHLPVWLGSMPSLRILDLSTSYLDGFVLDGSTPVTLETLAAFVAHESGQPRRKLTQAFLKMFGEDPLRLLRIAWVCIPVFWGLGSCVLSFHSHTDALSAPDTESAVCV
eukprot:TRINITY_DN4928_c0_g1_i4.p1 TRINITY_DN4928_c0_g1~~TRINITY_DN4928_c0_g1_i4.p1  ORF type:complete len:249 (+),score=49.65 TRINITY_DN4928_c0_g1_i4:189-935(+)